MRIVDCQQGSPEWFTARTGVVTASRFKEACSTLKSGEPAQASKDYAMELVFERLTGDMAPKFVNTAMSRGSELEPEAAEAYCIDRGEVLDTIGFVMHDTLPIGCSPDRLVGNDGLIEIKCPMDVKRVLTMWQTGDISEYIHQAQGQLWLTGREWCDLVVYDPRLGGAGMSLYVKRIDRDNKFIASMSQALENFVEYTKTIFDQIRENKK